MTARVVAMTLCVLALAGAGAAPTVVAHARGMFGEIYVVDEGAHRALRFGDARGEDRPADHGAKVTSIAWVRLKPLLHGPPASP